MKKKNRELLDNAFEEQYAQLNIAQRKAVDTIEGPVIVVAGPGTGKTQILTLRIANIIRNSGVGIDPENILALTFTHAGVMAMRARLTAFIGAEEAYRVNICTFHSFCEEHISRYSDYFPSIAYARVASEIEKIHMIEKILKDQDFLFLKTFGSDHHYTKDIIRSIDHLKREGVTPDDFLKRIGLQENLILSSDESYYKRATKNNKKGDLKIGALRDVKKNFELERVYRAYQDSLEKNSLYDFSDMIMQVVAVAEKNEEFSAILREQYQYILVDEHQDTNDGQNRIIEALTDQLYAGDSPNLFTVGDDKQAIYRFQGASVENFLRFEKKYPSATVIHLENNYRSAQGILDEAHVLISSGKANRKHKELIAAKGGDAHIRVLRFNQYKDEIVSIAEEIKEKLLAGVLPSDVAVFYREHHNVPYIIEVFEKIGVPYNLVAKQNALQDHDVRKLLILLKVIDDPYNDQNLTSYLLSDLSHVDVTDVLMILDEYRHTVKIKSLYTFLGIENNVCSDESKNAHAFIKMQMERVREVYLVEFFENLVRESGFFDMIIKRKDHASILEKMERIFDEIRDIVAQKDQCTLHELVEYFDTYDRYGLSLDVARRAQGSGVQMMTAHGSKGLEFEHVYITNVVHGLWGGKRKNEKFHLPIDVFVGDMEDERRLFYVAITRAKRSLTISYAHHDVSGREKAPSVFISDLSADLVDMGLKTTENYDISFLPRMRSILSIVSEEYIHDRFLHTPLSATALNNYYDSPIKYFFRNLVRLPSAQSKTMIKGTVMHAALEKFFSLSKEQKMLLSEDVLIELFERAIKIMRVPREYYTSIKKSGEESLRGYYRANRANFIVNTELEKKITGIPFLLEDGIEIILTGAIDKMEFLSDGTVAVVDYKSGKPWSRKTVKEKEALKRQVVFYKILLDRFHNGKYNMSKGILDFIEPHPKTGAYEREIISIESGDVERVAQEISIFARDVLSGDFLNREVEYAYGDHVLEEYIRLMRILMLRS